MTPFQSYRLSLVREGPAPDLALSRPADARTYLGTHFYGLDREHFAVVALDARNRPIGFNLTSIGALSASIVHPREVFKFAILANAASVILAHNHPSGDPAPSLDDTALTRRLVEGGEILGIEVMDHLIFADEQSPISLKERGLLG